MLNAGSTWGTAWLRSFWVAVGAGLGAAFPVWSTIDTGAVGWKPVIVAFGGAAILAAGIRGGVEGLSDASRNAKGNVKPGDVGQADQ